MGGVFETYTGTFRQVYWNGTNFLNKLPFVFKYISAFSHLAIHKEPFFNTTKKQSIILFFKTTYLFSKVIVPKHKNWSECDRGLLETPPAKSVPGPMDHLWCQVAALSHGSQPPGWHRGTGLGLGGGDPAWFFWPLSFTCKGCSQPAGFTWRWAHSDIY